MVLAQCIINILWAKAAFNIPIAAKFQCLQECLRSILRFGAVVWESKESGNCILMSSTPPLFFFFDTSFPCPFPPSSFSLHLLLPFSLLPFLLLLFFSSFLSSRPSVLTFLAPFSLLFLSFLTPPFHSSFPTHFPLFLSPYTFLSSSLIYN